MRSRCLVSAVALAGAAAVAGCGQSSGVHVQGGEPGSTAPSALTPSTTAPMPLATGVPEQAAILAQYRAFWASLTPVSKMTSSAARLAAVAKLAVDPELTRLMGGIAASRAMGQVFYGAIETHPVLTAVTAAGVAILTDCQDASSHGRAKSSTGQEVTVGTKNDFAKVTMRRGPDGVWRIATVAYQSVGSCHANA